MDIGMVPALCAVVKTCRDREARREALGILRSNPRREGLWDSAVVAGFGQWIMELVEKEAVGDYIPEHARVRLTKVDVDVLAKTAKLECVKRAGANGELLVRQRSISSCALSKDVYIIF
jgi:hypothetical protein